MGSGWYGVAVSNESEPKSSPPRVSSESARTNRVTLLARKPFLADASMMGLGTQIFSEVIAGVVLGLGTDYLLGTKGRWVVVGAIVGVCVAMWTMIRIALNMKGVSASRANAGKATSTPNSSSAVRSGESRTDEAR
jgi:F0F1-type ATP synthase assembly protein I